MNQPNGNRANLLSNRERKALANRASTTCSHSVKAAPSTVPIPSSATAANPISFNRDDSAPDANSLASSTSSRNGASCTSVITACSTPEAISADRNGPSNRPAAWARQLPRAAGSAVGPCCTTTLSGCPEIGSSPRRVPIARPTLQ